MNLRQWVPPAVSQAWDRAVGKSGLTAWAQSWMRGDDVSEASGTVRLTMPYVQSPWVFGACNLILGEFTGLDLKFFAGESEYEDAALDAWWQAPALGNDRKPVRRGDVDKILGVHLLNHGEFFILLDDSWTLAGLRRRPESTNRFVVARPDRVRLIIQGSELAGYEYIDAGGRRSVWLPDQVIHKMEPNPYDDWRGIGRAQVARVAVEGVFLTGVYIRDLMRNNGDQGFIVVGKNGVASAEQREQIVADLQAKRRALRGGQAKDLFLTGDITIDRADQQAMGADLANTKGLSQQEIFIAYGVPPSMSAVKQSYSIGKDSDRYQLVTGSSQPAAAKIAGAYAEIASRQTGKELRAEHDWDDHPVMQEVRNSRLDAALKLWASGMPWKEINDYLSLGMKPFPGWEIAYLPFSVTPVDAGGAPADEPTADPALGEPAAEDDQVKHLKLLLLARQRSKQVRPATPAEPCQCGCAPLDGLLQQIDKGRDSREIALWREQMKGRREQMKGFESRFRSALFKVRQEVLRKIEAKYTKAVGKTAAIELLFDVANLGADLVQGMRKQHKLALDAAGKQVYAELGKEDPFEFAPADVQRFIDGRANKLSGVPDQVFERIRGSLQDGLDAGDSTADLASRVRAEFNAIDRGRSHVIAQTEVSAAFGYGRQEAMAKAGVARKRWLTSGNDNVRPAHRDANGQTVAVDEPFVVDGEELMNPGDSGGSPDNTINCHCVAIAVADGDE